MKMRETIAAFFFMKILFNKYQLLFDILEKNRRRENCYTGIANYKYLAVPRGIPLQTQDRFSTAQRWLKPYNAMVWLEHLTQQPENQASDMADYLEKEGGYGMNGMRLF